MRAPLSRSLSVRSLIDGLTCFLGGSDKPRGRGKEGGLDLCCSPPVCFFSEDDELAAPLKSELEVELELELLLVDERAAA